MMATATAFCGRCGEREDLCACFRAQDVADRVRKEMRAAVDTLESRDGEKSPGLAAGLSLLIPGLGQLYNGEMLKAGLFLVGWILVIPWALAVMDAYYSARLKNVEARLKKFTVRGVEG
jgi:hypothetical protein